MYMENGNQHILIGNNLFQKDRAKNIEKKSLRDDYATYCITAGDCDVGFTFKLVHSFLRILTSIVLKEGVHLVLSTTHSFLSFAFLSFVFFYVLYRDCLHERRIQLTHSHL